MLAEAPASLSVGADALKLLSAECCGCVPSEGEAAVQAAEPGHEDPRVDSRTPAVPNVPPTLAADTDPMHLTEPPSGDVL